MAREEYLQGNWFKGPEKLGERGKTNDVWKIIKRMNKDVINIVYSSSIIALENFYRTTPNTIIQTGTLWQKQ